jgi:hypothetical protein
MTIIGTVNVPNKNSFFGGRSNFFFTKSFLIIKKNFTYLSAEMSAASNGAKISYLSRKLIK